MGNEPAIRAVIFDMDGLLLDSEVYWEEARRDYAKSMSCDWTPQDELGAKGLNSPEWAALIAQRCGLEVDRDQIMRAVIERMQALYERHLPLLPGAVELVRELAASHPLGIASSSPPSLIEFVLAKAGIRPCFSVVVSADQVGKGKPSPDVYLVTAQRMQVDPWSVAVFEDSSAGIMSAHAAGMRVIAVPNAHYPPSKEALAQADLVLHSSKEFRSDMLQQLQA